MKLLITDTCVFFDLLSIGALPEFFGLDFEICTTVFVIDEINKSEQKKKSMYSFGQINSLFMSFLKMKLMPSK